MAEFVVYAPAEEAPPRAISPLSGDFIVIPKQVRSGTVYIEAKLQEDIEEVHAISKIQEDLEDELSKSHYTFELGEDLLNDKSAALVLGAYHVHCKEILQSLKVTEYIGPDTTATYHSLKNVRVQILVYKLYDTREAKDTLEQAEVTCMPHVNFDGGWDDLVFEKDLKADLTRIMTNMVRFSQRSNNRTSATILLYGPPGTGKTTLCQGLAQKVSIRLTSTYRQTKLIQIRTATLLSKFYSESAKQVDMIFATIVDMCEEDPEQFICVLIDEVESIAGSRESSMHGEVQDSLRATNALLTGLDRAKKYQNIIFLCTSNMLDCLDAAFLDRCGLTISIDAPSRTVQYEILRGRLQTLIANDYICASDSTLPCYRDAQLEYTSNKKELIGSKLLRIISFINSSRDESVSGRYLAQLPEQSILRYLGDEECSLDMAIQFIERSVIQRVPSRGGSKSITQDEPTGGQGKHGRELDDEDDIEYALDAIESLVSSLRAKRVRAKRVKEGGA